MSDASVRLASTIGPIESGIVPALAEAYRRASGVEVRYRGAGTGAALELARRGGFDAVLAHAPALEERFVREGYGTERHELMHNDFVLFGPAADPARVRGARSAADAFARVAARGAPWLTRADQSGTHVKELDIWAAAGIRPDGAWYRVAATGPRGNTATAEEADAQGAYTLLDRATAQAVAGHLTRIGLLYEGDPALLNIISAILVNPTRVANVDRAQGARFLNWLLGDQARVLIASFGQDRFGQPLYVPRTTPTERLRPPARASRAGRETQLPEEVTP